jgi:hypothetical protein
MKLLSVLIPTLPDRKDFLFDLLDELHYQMEQWNIENEVEIITDDTGSSLSIGAKRQKLLEKAKGEYITFIDDDDKVLNDYLWVIINGIKSVKPDVVSFNGYMTTNGINRENFKIRKDFPYITIQDTNGKNEYLRYNNHLSPIKREIALKIGYKDMRVFEDYDYAKRLKESGLIKTEYYFDDDLYHYKYIPHK